MENQKIRGEIENKILIFLFLSISLSLDSLLHARLVNDIFIGTYNSLIMRTHSLKLNSYNPITIALF